MVYLLFKTKVARHRTKEFHEAFPNMISALEKGGAKIIGVWTVEMGPLDQVLLLYAVESFDAFEKALAGLGSHAQGPFGDILPTIYTDEERWILRPTPYSPLQ